MEVVMPVQEFHFESATTTPYMSAPSSPKHFGVDPMEFYYPYAGGAPTSPTAGDVEDDFAFDFSGHLEKNAPPPPLTSADELFDQGKIRPLRPPPRLCSPPDPFAGTVNRGRNSTPCSAFSPSISQSPKKSRSLSPLRAGKGSTNHFQTTISSHPPPITTVSCSCKGGGGSDGSWKWRIKDLLLFRSASEGRATGDRSKDFLRKFAELPSSSSSPPKLKKAGSGDVSRSSSFRSVDSSGSVSRRGGTRRAVSPHPHARHYTTNKAAADELKKKTALPYRQSFFSCLRFSPALHGLTGRG